MQNLIATGLIDQYHLNTHPVVLGAVITATITRNLMYLLY